MPLEQFFAGVIKISALDNVAAQMNCQENINAKTQNVVLQALHLKQRCTTQCTCQKINNKLHLYIIY